MPVLHPKVIVSFGAWVGTVVAVTILFGVGLGFTVMTEPVLVFDPQAAKSRIRQLPRKQ